MKTELRINFFIERKNKGKGEANVLCLEELKP